MTQQLQKASILKRVAAGLFDSIFVCILTVGLAFLLSLLFGYDEHSQLLDEKYNQYEKAYGVTFDITQEEYQKLSAEEKKNYDNAYDALIKDEDALYAYNMTINLTLLITTLSILISILVWEFLLPLIFGNGQTFGKKIFTLCIVRNDSVKMNTMQLFVRSVLGKFTIETMIPVYILIMLFLGTMDITGTFFLFALLIAQLLIICISKTNSLIHDLLAGTVVVDYSSQRIFRSTADLIEYQKKIAAERAARQVY